MSGIGSFRGECEFCTKPVTSGDRAAFRVRGWELERAQGGMNHVVGKERQSDRIAHALCVTSAVREESRGLRGQTSLI
jgi:hypothetical protein